MNLYGDSSVLIPREDVTCIGNSGVVGGEGRYARCRGRELRSRQRLKIFWPLATKEEKELGQVSGGSENKFGGGRR